MGSCLGLYIENNIIKYAKVTKEHDNTKIDSFGVKFYDNIEHGIKQIIDETYSYKTPISINLSGETYNYFNMFSLLNKNDLQKAIKTEFEAYCSEKNYNINAFESRYAAIQNIQEQNKLKVIYVSANKIELNKRMQQFGTYKLSNISPISMIIPNIAKFEPRENSLIVNIEGKTTITTILDQKIYDVKVFEKGCEEILDKINSKENSYSKAYEICKETTIYTSEGKDLIEEEAQYLEFIMPTLYDIVGQVRKTINENTERISKIYITGTGALINNVDLYFEEYLEDVKCEILKPEFLKITPDINIKDYVEVNSAISLALSQLGEGITGMNFKKTSLSDKMPELMKLEVNFGKKEGKIAKDLFKTDFSTPLDRVETNLIRLACGLLILFFVYSGFSYILAEQMNKKMQQAEESIQNTQTQISLAEADNEKLKSKINDYKTRISNLESINEKIEKTNKTKKSIPNLLNKLMYLVPENVQIKSIENTTDTHIEIIAQASQYDQLGYLKASIQTSGMLMDVISTMGQKENNIVVMKIEGELP